MLSTVKIGHSSITMYISKKKRKKERKTSCFLKQFTYLYVDNIIKESSKKQKGQLLQEKKDPKWYNQQQ